MGDRTDVYLTIRKADQSKLESLCDDFNEVFEDVTSPGKTTTIEYSWYEVNYANLNIEKALQENLIPYDKNWGQGGEYNGGTEYHRVNEAGSSIVKEFEDGMEGMVALSEVSYALSAGTIDEYVLNKTEELYIIPWSRQESILAKLQTNDVDA